MRAELRRSIFLACVGLLAGFALVVTLYGAGTLFKRGLGAPVGPGSTEESGPPAAKPSAGAADLNGSARRDAVPEEGAAPAGKPLAALGAVQPPARAAGSQAGSQAPTFDIIRIEPSGEAVIAGRAAPNTTVELLRDNEPIARALVDPSGQFAIVPPSLPSGNSELTLRALGADGQARVSRDSVAVVVSLHRNAKPLIALTSPDKPTIVLSQPDPTPMPPGGEVAGADKADSEKTGKADGGGLATNMPGARAATGSASPASAAAAGAKADADRTGPLKIVSVEAEEGGRLYVTSQAPPGATVRLYLNDALVAPGSAGADGRVAFTIGRGVRPGDYKVRVDQVDPVSGKVKTRSEVAFNVPVTVAKPTAPGVVRPSEGGAILAQGNPPPVVAVPGTAARLGTPQNPAALPAAAQPRTLAPQPPAALGSVNPGAGVPRAAPLATAQANAMQGQAPADRSPTVFVPEIGTAKIIRGDSLWQISRRIYGKGTRYTVIFDANQPQIRNPDLIYPGQIFVLPTDGTAAVPQADRRG
ncbi:LysM peptidoglycan-binding domain-containing protein [Methylobacterium sp. M6A4_1b]